MLLEDRPVGILDDVCLFFFIDECAWRLICAKQAWVEAHAIAFPYARAWIDNPPPPLGRWRAAGVWGELHHVGRLELWVLRPNATLRQLALWRQKTSLLSSLLGFSTILRQGVECAAWVPWSGHHLADFELDAHRCIFTLERVGGKAQWPSFLRANTYSKYVNWDGNVNFCVSDPKCVTTDPL